MEQASNLFTDGLITDSHPLTTPNNALTDALNATFRTHNGNELMIQNDMGNTTICDSTTGNIMGLDDGFVPVGMKEYGGILYIASYNQETKEGQLGTIPSPLINYTYSELKALNFNAPLTKSPSTTSNIDLRERGVLYFSEPFLISTDRFTVGDLFIISLNISNLGTNLYRNVCKETEVDKKKRVVGNGTNLSAQETYPLISKVDGDNIPIFGLYKLSLLAKVENSTDTFRLDSITSKLLIYYLDNSFSPVLSDYWFIPITSTSSLNLDEDLCQAAECYRTYPNMLPGYLYSLIEPVLIDSEKDIYFFKNNSTFGHRSPIAHLITITEE